MFTTLPFVVISLLFTIFGFFLVGALSGLLAIYSASKSENASSIRWSRQGGYVEMFRTVIHSARHVPRSATAALIIMIIANLISMFANVGLSRMVTQTDIEINPGTLLSQTNQLIASYVIPVGWTEYLGRSAAAIEILTAMLVNPRYIINMDSEKQYTPKIYPYEVACNTFDILMTPNLLATTLDPIKNSLYFPDGGCSVIGFEHDSSLLNWTLLNSTYEKISEKRYKLVTSGSIMSSPGMIYMYDIPPKLFFADSSWCPSDHDSEMAFTEIPKNGMTYLPSTMIFKCQQSTGEMQVATATTFPFAIRHVEEYDNVTSTIFDDPAPLFLLDTMGTLLRNGTFANPNVNSTLVVLTDASGSMIHYLGCNSRWATLPNDLWFLCRYIVLDAMTTTPNEGDPTIAAVIGDRSTSLVPYTTNLISLLHLVSSTTEDGIAVYPVSEIFNATTALTLYMASLGPNLVVDNINQQVTIMYDTADIQSVSEISTTLVWIMVAVMILCAGIMLFAITKYDVKHRGSLYMVLYEKIKPRLDESDPALMNCTFEPMALDGIGILQKDNENIER